MCFEVANAIHVIPRHVFGDHSRCASKYPLCDGVPHLNEKNHVPMLEKWHYVIDVEEAISRLSRHSYSLLLNFDTNLVESANAIVAEKIGGKRINYALRNEYTARVLEAALQFNTRQVTIQYYKTAGKQIPKITEAVEKQSQEKHEKRKKRLGRRQRRKGGKKKGNEDYGSDCQEVDMDEKTYNIQLKIHRDKMNERIKNRIKIEKETRKQATNPKWWRHRKFYITCTTIRNTHDYYYQVQKHN